ncbi:MAG: crossover junction endodeoxyribonuclease RuvC [Pseudomonadota bacterium]
MSGAHPGIRIIGIDPGSRATGYGVIDCRGTRLSLAGCGVIRTRSADFNERLKEIFEAAGELLGEYRPNELAIERVFVRNNADSALKLGAARAAVICASFGHGLPVHEYAPRAVKQALTGRGSADKDQVQHMVRTLLAVTETLAHDASDALAVAICRSHDRSLRDVLEASA